MRRPLITLVVACGLLMSISQVSGAPTLTVTPLANPSGPLESARQVSISRDVGLSVAQGGKNYWFFGDTYVPASASANTGSLFVGGSTAAVSSAIIPGRSPTDLTEIKVGSLTPNVLPSQFLPPTTPAYIPGTNGVQCSQWPRGRTLRWITGAATIPSTLAASSILITYIGVCLEPSRVTVQSFGFGVFSTSTNSWSLVRDVIPPKPSGYELPERFRFSYPTFNTDGTVTFFSSRCIVGAVSFLCDKTVLHATTMPATFVTMSNPASYNPTPVADLADGMNAALYAVGVMASSPKTSTYYVARLDDFAGLFRIFSATKIGGPYTAVGTGTLPSCTDLPAGRFCYAFMVHPELSPPGNLYVSYFTPGSRGSSDHISAALITLPGGTPPTSTTTSSTSSTTSTTVRAPNL